MKDMYNECRKNRIYLGRKHRNDGASDGASDGANIDTANVK